MENVPVLSILSVLVAGCSLRFRPIGKTRNAAVSATSAIDAAPGYPKEFWDEKVETIPPPVAATDVKPVHVLFKDGHRDVT